MVAFARATCLAVLLCVLFPLNAAAQEPYFTTEAEQAIIVDYETGEILFEKDARRPVPPASMSKLMTVAVLLDMLEQGTITPETEFYVSRRAWQTGGSKMFVLVDTQIPVLDLLKGIIVLSGNDACIVVAENVTSPQMGNVTSESQLGTIEAFAEIMNRKAAEWGLEQSTFANPTGLPDPDQLMSMYDLAQLSTKIITDYPEWYESLFSIPEFTWSDITQQNRNPLVGAFEGADGLKTGHTEESGYGVAASAVRDGVRRIIVLHGLDSMSERAREGRRVMGLAFSQFSTRRYFDSGDVVADAEVFLGRQATVPLKIKNDLVFTRHNSVLANAEARVIYEGPIKAPVRAEQQVGILRLEMPGEPVREIPLYTAAPVKGIGVIGKMGIGLRALFTPPSAREVVDQ